MDLIKRCAKKHPVMISIEEGSVGGFAAHVMQYLCCAGLLDGGLKFRPMTLPDRWVGHSREERRPGGGGTASRSALQL